MLTYLEGHTSFRNYQKVKYPSVGRYSMKIQGQDVNGHRLVPTC